MIDTDMIVDKLFAKFDSKLTAWQEGLKRELDEMKVLVAGTHASLQALATGVTEVSKRVDSVVKEVEYVKKSQALVITEVARLCSTVNSTALLEERLNTMRIMKVPVQGTINIRTVAAAVRSALAEAGVVLSHAVGGEDQVWSLSVVKGFSNRKLPGTANAIIRVLTSEKRRAILDPKVTKNLKAKGISISTDLTPAELGNKSKLFSDQRFLDAYKKATDLRKAEGGAACIKHWVLDKCILGTGNGSEKIVWSVEYLQQLDGEEQAAAGTMHVDLVHG